MGGPWSSCSTFWPESASRCLPAVFASCSASGADGVRTRNVFGAVVLGYLADRVGRRRMFLVNLLIYSGFTLAAAFAPNLTFGRARVEAADGAGPLAEYLAIACGPRRARRLPVVLLLDSRLRERIGLVDRLAGLVPRVSDDHRRGECVHHHDRDQDQPRAESERGDRAHRERERPEDQDHHSWRAHGCRVPGAVGWETRPPAASATTRQCARLRSYPAIGRAPS